MTNGGRVTFSCAHKWDHYATDVVLLFVFVLLEYKGQCIYVGCKVYGAPCRHTLLGKYITPQSL